MPLTVSDSLYTYVIPPGINNPLNYVQNSNVFNRIDIIKCLKDHLLQLAATIIELKVINNTLIYRLVNKGNVSW